MRFRPAVAALFAAAAFVPGPKATAAPPKPDVGFTKDSNAVLKTLRNGLAARAATLKTALADATKQPTDVGAMLGAIGDAYVLADSDVGELLFAATSGLDKAASQRLVDASATSAPGLIVGAGGAIDAALAKVEAEAAKYSKAAATAMQNAVRAARKAFPQSTFAVRAFPAVSSGPTAPGTNPNAAQTNFVARAPVLLLCAGTPGGIRLFVGGRGNAAGSQQFNVYDADGALQMASSPLTAVGDRRLRANVAVTGTFPNAHGNLVVEAFRDSTGWTYSIGY